MSRDLPDRFGAALPQSSITHPLSVACSCLMARDQLRNRHCRLEHYALILALFHCRTVTSPCCFLSFCRTLEPTLPQLNGATMPDAAADTAAPSAAPASAPLC
jgi:hypothetical protein